MADPSNDVALCPKLRVIGRARFDGHRTRASCALAQRCISIINAFADRQAGIAGAVRSCGIQKLTSFSETRKWQRIAIFGEGRNLKPLMREIRCVAAEVSGGDQRRGEAATSHLRVTFRQYLAT
jgi:hypothetical protein